MTVFQAAELRQYVAGELNYPGTQVFSLTLASGHRADEAAYCTLTLTSNGRGSFYAPAPKNARFIGALALSRHLPFIGLSISNRVYGGLARVRVLASKDVPAKLVVSPSLDCVLLEVEIVEMTLEESEAEPCRPQT